MKKYLGIFLLLSVLGGNTFANGVMFLDPESNSYLEVVRSEVDVTIKQQVAIVTTTQYFINNSGFDTTLTYAFPIPENGSAIDVKWQIGQLWYAADLAAGAQDSSLVGTGTWNNSTLEGYLGNNALWLQFEQVVQKDSMIKVVTSYVELLEYSFNTTTFSYPNDYESLFQSAIDSQFFTLSLESQRSLTALDLVSHSGGAITVNSFDASIDYSAFKVPADKDYLVTFSFAPDELGMYSYSTMLLPGMNNCDSFGDGYFALIIEPESGDSLEVIGKDFILIMDQSGSMKGSKIVQAKEAAQYIINNMNDGDRFNIVKFSSSAFAYADSLVSSNIQNQLDANQYIENISAGGGTNFGDALTMGIPYLGESDSSRAQIVLFVTDGIGTPSGQDLLSLVSGLRSQYSPNLNFFSVGIGSNVNTVDLTQVAQQNNGFAIYLDNGDLSTTLADFYLTIQNPVLLNTTLDFSPAIVEEVFPTSLPNLYAGQQLVLFGRYVASDSISVTLSGNLGGLPVSQTQTIFLTDSLIYENLFLYKLWGKRKIDNLMSQYLASVSSTIADSVKAEIIQVSTCYGVLSPFTNFSGNGGGSGSGSNAGGSGNSSSSPYFYASSNRATDESVIEKPKLIVYPNPSTEEVFVEWPGNYLPVVPVLVSISDMTGRVVFQKEWNGSQPFAWDGLGPDGRKLVPGEYLVHFVWEEESYQALLIRR